MIIYSKAGTIQVYLQEERKKGRSVGFVPTMGALHRGHIGLLHKAKEENDISVCSIFVNPTQFNDPKDFRKYPHTIEKDIYRLEKAGCDILFLPPVSEIYPVGLKRNIQYDLGALESVLEGKYRPGHFQGVCQVVHRLLEIIQPSSLYLGQKDFQQCMVLKKLVELIKMDTQIIVCPTQRETDGLAMSSRNLLLTAPERKKAVLISQTLSFIKEEVNTGYVGDIKERAKQYLKQEGFKVDYVEIADTITLAPVESWNGDTKLIALIAAYLNEVRLIDNMIL